MNSISSRTGALALAFGIVGACAVVSATAQPQRDATSEAGYLNAGDVERQALAQGIVTVREIELEGRLAEVEGRDANQNKVKLVVDRQTGEVLKRKTKTPKAGR